MLLITYKLKLLYQICFNSQIKYLLHDFLFNHVLSFNITMKVTQFIFSHKYLISFHNHWYLQLTAIFSNIHLEINGNQNLKTHGSYPD